MNANELHPNCCDAVDLGTVAVVIPCRNEQAEILSVVATLPEGLGQWLVVDNGSDATCSQLLKEQLSPENVLRIPQPLGVGGAFLVGSQALKPEIRWVCKLDGDGQFNAVALGAFLERAQRSERSLVKTARCDPRDWRLNPDRAGSRHWGNQLLTLLVAMASGYYLLEDGTSGLFLIDRSALRAAEAMGGLRHDHGFETTLLINLGALGADLLELRVPIRYSPHRKRTFVARALALPLLMSLWGGLSSRLLRSHLVYRLSAGGCLLLLSGGLLVAGLGLTAVAAIKAVSLGIPTTPGISAAATSLLSWGILGVLGFLAYDFASTFQRYRNASAFDCWQPMATHGIQATKNHQPKRPS